MMNPVTLAPASLRIAAALSLLGWGALHLFWSVPYRALLWSESLLGGVVTTLFGMSWTEWVTSDRVELLTQAAIRGLGLILIAAGIVTLARPAWLRRARGLLWASAAILVTVSLMLWKQSGFQAAMFIEHASQVGAPFLVLLACAGAASTGASPAPSGIADATRLRFWSKLLIIGTFLGHGLYAIGFYAVPGNFLDMIINILGVSESAARELLAMAGALDIILCLGLFSRDWERPALAYAVFWGLATTLARPVSALALGVDAESLLHWTAQALCRAPHAGLPLAALALTFAADRAPIRRRRVPVIAMPAPAPALSPST